MDGHTVKAIAIGGCLVASVVALVVYYRRSSKQTPTPERPTEERSVQSQPGSVWLSELSDTAGAERPLYRESVKDEWQYRVVPGSLNAAPRLGGLQYRVLLNLNKGLTYEGAVTVGFTWSGPRDRPLELLFNGDEVYHLSVNGLLVPEEEVVYALQRIRIEPRYLVTGSNRVEVIFANKYSFFDEGLSTYFKINDDNKYSLKEQCIYSRNNRANAGRILPCFDVRAECRVELQVLHPENFQAVSNAEKQLIRLVGSGDLLEYRFFVEDSNVNASTLNSSFSSRTSTRSVKSKVKYCTRFREVRLQSIQEFFVACLPVSEVRCKHGLGTLLRFYCRKSLLEKAAALIPQLLNQLEQIEKRVGRGRFHSKKVDVLFINSTAANGHFARGVVLLKESVLARPLRPKTVYLLVRALLGMEAYRERPDELQQLNLAAAEAFPQIRNYLSLMQVRYERVRSLKVPPDYADFFAEIFQAQLTFLCPGLEPSAAVAPWLHALAHSPAENFWQYFADNYEFADGSIGPLLIKMGLRLKGLPNSPALLARLKGLLETSPYLIEFMANSEIEPQLERLARQCEKGLRRRLPQLSLSEESLQGLSASLAREANVAENREECVELYEQFANFDDRKNFHHCSVIRAEIDRIRQFLPTPLTEVDLRWSLSATKAMYRLNIHNRIDPTLGKMLTVYNELM